MDVRTNHTLIVGIVAVVAIVAIITVGTNKEATPTNIYGSAVSQGGEMAEPLMDPPPGYVYQHVICIFTGTSVPKSCIARDEQGVILSECSGIVGCNLHFYALEQSLVTLTSGCPNPLQYIFNAVGGWPQYTFSCSGVNPDLCHDDDSGYAIYMPGEVLERDDRGVWVAHQDICCADTLHEYSCNSGVLVEQVVDCPLGCIVGACRRPVGSKLDVMQEP